MILLLRPFYRVHGTHTVRSNVNSWVSHYWRPWSPVRRMRTARRSLAKPCNMRHRRWVNGAVKGIDLVSYKPHCLYMHLHVWLIMIMYRYITYRCIYVYIYICMYIYMYLCIYVYMYMYIIWYIYDMYIYNMSIYICIYIYVIYVWYM